MKKRQIVPSFLTSMNLLCGFMAILINDPIQSFYLILIGIAFDFVDGFSARVLKVPSAFGKELDSLADMVSFGVAPGFLYYQHVLRGPEENVALLLSQLLVATLIPVLAALRLAKFNVKDGGKIGFEGLPSSAAALAIISIPFGLAQANHAAGLKSYMDAFADSTLPQFALALGFALLMVSKLSLFNFKNFKGGLKANSIQLIYLISVIALVVAFRDSLWLCMLISITWYILLSLTTVPIWKKS